MHRAVRVCKPKLSRRLLTHWTDITRFLAGAVLPHEDHVGPAKITPAEHTPASLYGTGSDDLSVAAVRARSEEINTAALAIRPMHCARAAGPRLDGGE